ncbi:hypothetical protein ACHAQI_006505 [Fusarium lateritium]
MEISDPTAQASDDLNMSEFHCFLSLPRELRDEIVAHAIPPLVVPCHVQTGSITSAGEHSLSSLKLSCRSIYEAVQRVRRVKGISDATNSPHPHVFSFNPDKDTLRVWEMRLPRSTRVEDAAGLPVKRLISMTNQMSSVPVLMAITFHAKSHPNGVDQSLPLKKLKLDKLPHLQELIIENISFWADAPQYGDSVGTSEESRQQHVGIEWKANRTRYPSFKEELLNSRVKHRWKIWCFEALKIGLHGYTPEKAMLGGFWAGFRYFEESEEVWFSPLSWYEVRDIMMKPATSKTVGEEALYEDHHAQFVARVWIIRSGQAAPKDEPHHRWVKVSFKWAQDPDWAYKIWITWEAIWRVVEGQTYGQEIYTLQD